MAIELIKRKKLSHKTMDELVRLLREEIRRPEPKTAPPNAPVIISERGFSGKSVSYHVIWDRFKGVDRETRFNIAFSALSEEKPDEMPHVIGIDAVTVSEAKQNELINEYLDEILALRCVNSKGPLE